jgi:hypothetical protein
MSGHPCRHPGFPDAVNAQAKDIAEAVVAIGYSGKDVIMRGTKRSSIGAGDSFRYLHLFYALPRRRLKKALIL